MLQTINENQAFPDMVKKYLFLDLNIYIYLSIHKKEECQAKAILKKKYLLQWR